MVAEIDPCRNTHCEEVAYFEPLNHSPFPLEMALLIAVLAFIVPITSQAESTIRCGGSLDNLTDANKNFGWVDTFYNAAKSISANIQAKESEAYLQVLSNVCVSVTDSTLQKEEIISLIKCQTGAIVFIAIGVVILIGIPISGICFCSCRLCGKRGVKRKRAPSKYVLFAGLFALLIGIVFVAVLMGIYVTAVEDTAENVDELGNITISVGTDVGNVLTTASGNVTCELDGVFGKFFEHLSEIISEIPEETFSEFENEYGYNKIKSILSGNDNISSEFSYANISASNATMKLNDLCNESWSDKDEIESVLQAVEYVQISLFTVNNHFMSLHKDLSNTFDDVDKKINGCKAQIADSINEAQKSLQTAKSDVHEISEKIDTTVDEINFQISNLTDKIQNILEDLDESPIKTGAFHGLRALVLAPCVLVAVPSLVAIIFGLCRFSLSDSGCSKRSRIYNCGGIFAMFGVFCGFVFGWIVILVATLSFLGGYGMEMVCKPLFDDPHMRLLHSIPTFKFEVPPLYDSNSATIIEFDEVLMQCNQHLSIFTALNGNTIMNVSAILQQANLEKYKEEAIDKFNKQSFNYVLNETYSNLLDSATSKLQAAVDELETHLNKTTAAAGNDANKTAQVKDVEKTLEDMKSLVDDLIHVISETLNDVKNVSTVALNSGNFTDKGVKMITRIFDDTIENVTEKVYAAKDQLLMNTSDCYPLYEVWQTVGFTLCDRVGKPLQGMWASAGLAAIFIVVLIVALIPVAKYLQHTEPKYNRFGAKHARPHVSNHLRYNRSNKAQQPPAVTKTTIATTERLYATRSSPYSYVNNGYYSYSKPIYNRSQYH